MGEDDHVAAAEGLVVPANAELNILGNGWKCSRGFVRFENECAPVAVPRNASLNALGNGWQCNRGSKRVDARCEPMTPEELARYDAMMQAAMLAALACGTSYDYDVEGYGGEDYGYVYGDIDACSDQQDVSGTLYLEDGTAVSFDGEWDGNGEVEGYDEHGNYYELEVD